MKGAMAEPLAKTIKAPKNNSVKIMGNSQNFFLTLRNPHKSLKKFMVQLLDPLAWRFLVPKLHLGTPYPAKLSLAFIFVPKCNLGTSGNS
jgi:hypothetical protein